MRLRSFRAWIPVASAASALGAFFSPIGCAQLAPLAPRACGNGVVDTNEDCDGFAPYAGTSCRPPGAAGACRFDCTKDGSGAGPSCPDGWGCGSDHICREATGKFELPRVIGRGATRLALADFDADGRQDVFLVDQIDAQGIGRSSVRYFDDRFALSETTQLGEFYMMPAVLSPSDGSLPSLGLVPAGSGLAFLRGRRDRAFDAAIQSSFSWNDHIYGVVHRDDTEALAIKIAHGSSVGWFGYDGIDFTQHIPGDVIPYSSDFISAKITPDAPCESLAYLSNISTPPAIEVVPLCDSQGGWNTSLAPTKIPVDGSVDPSGIVFADVNADGVLDIVFRKDAELVVAYAASGFGNAVSFSQPKPVPGSIDLMPIGGLLAASDLNLDGIVDYAATDGLRTSHKSGSTVTYRKPFSTIDSSWSNARFADLDGDGTLDLVASSAARYSLTFVKGGIGTPLRATITLPGHADWLTMGDFDGDLLSDVAYRQQDGEKTSVGILFGHAGLPGPAVTALDVDGLDQIAIADGRHDLEGNSTPARLIARSTDARTNTSHISYIEESSVRQVFSPTLIPSGDPIFAVAPQSANASSTSALALALVTHASGIHVTLQAIATDGGAARNLVDLGEIAPSDLVPLGLLARGDVNGDGYDDVVLFVDAPLGDLPGPQGRSTLAVVLGDGGSSWHVLSSEIFTASLEPFSTMALEDLDGDGALDLVVLASDGARKSLMKIRWNAGNGAFSTTDEITLAGSSDAGVSAFAPVSVAPHEPRAIAYGESGGPISSVVLLAFDRSRTMDSRQITASLTGPLSSIAAGDLDADGVDDIVYVDPTGLVLLHGVATQP